MQNSFSILLGQLASKSSAEHSVLRRREIDRERVNESAEEREARLSRNGNNGGEGGD